MLGNRRRPPSSSVPSTATSVHLGCIALLRKKNEARHEELLLEQFSGLIKFVKSRPDETAINSEKASVAEVEPLVKDFASRYKAAIELMHYDVITSFSNFLCGMEVLRATLLLYYTRLSECVKRVSGGSALNKDLVSISPSCSK